MSESGEELQVGQVAGLGEQGAGWEKERLE